MRNDSSSDVAASEAEAEGEDERSITAVADEPAITRERVPEVQPGDLLAGRYQIEAVIGKGGSGVVLRAFDRVSATVVAVKVLKPGLTHDPRWEKRFQRELRLGRPIRHPNVCRIFDIGDAEGYRFLTMEFATGGTLRDLIKKNQPLRPLAERLADAAGVIAGLAAIHGAGIVHRDVKPDNLLRMEDGRLVLSDFGLATDLPDSTMVSVFVGTPHYMAPEVREGDPATTRSDVWSLGVVLHEIFVGRRPGRRNSRSGANAALGQATKTSSTIQRAMLALCERCLADDPAERPEDARAVERLIHKARQSPYAMLKLPRRRFVLYAAVGIAALSLAAAFGIGTHIRTAAPVHSGIVQLLPTGAPADWSKVANVMATLSGHVHCFSAVDDDTVRLIWGEPRQAEDIDIPSGKRHASPLTPDTYANGCPEFSSKSKRLVFTAHSAAGAAEIRVLAADNRSASVVTPGSEPLWLRNGDEFVYTLDAGHAAVYSLATMRFSLLADSGLQGQLIFQKAASRSADRVALLLTNEREEWAIAVYEGIALERRRTFTVNAARRVDFDSPRDDLWVSYQLSKSLSTIAKLEWRTGSLRHVGSMPGSDIIGLERVGGDAAIVARRRAHDLWLHDGANKQRITADGESTSGAIGPTGEPLLGRRTEDGTYSIWQKDRRGVMRRLTTGPSDVSPDYSRDGRAWTYASYVEKSIKLCSADTNECKSIHQDEFLPSSPRFSPDGLRIAYVRQIGTPRLVVMTLGTGELRHLGPAYVECPPVWTSENSVWAVDGSPGNYHWSERNIATGQHTGRQLPLGREVISLDEPHCWPADARAGSAFFPRLRVEVVERSEVAHFRGERLSP